MERIDCVIPAHEKDFEVLGAAVASIRRCCPEVRRIVIVSRSPWAAAGDHGAEWVDEAAECWPFRLEDLQDCGCAPGWLLQQLLKLYAPSVLPGLAETVLVCDADVVWIDGRGPVRFLEPAGGHAPPEGPAPACLCTFDAEGCPPIRSAVDLHRYDDFVPAVLPGLRKQRPGAETAVCHHMCLQRGVLDALADGVGAAHGGAPLWAVFRDAARACGGRASEYELYAAFARQRFPGRVALRRLAFAVVGDLQAALRAPPEGAAFVVAHSHLRGLSAEELLDREGVINGDVPSQILKRMTRGCPPELCAAIAGSGML